MSRRTAAAQRHGRKRWLTLALGITLALANPASAHPVAYDGYNAKCLDRSGGMQSAEARADCDHVQKVIHRIFKYDDHEAIRIFSCESGLNKWSGVNGGSHKGIVQASDGFRASYPKGPAPWTWRVAVQIRAAWQAVKDSEWQHWGEGQSWGCA